MFDRPFSPETLRQSGRAMLDKALAEPRREVPGVTIDGATSRDFDDAIWVEPKSDGGYTVTVSIADVASLVPKNSAMDRDAMNRATSLYRVDGVSPMLPGRLSDNLCSLRPGEMRPTVTASMELDHNLNVTDVKLENTKLVSKKRYTYEQATHEIADNNNPMHEWGKLANGLLEKRRKQGALAFYDRKSGVYASGDSDVQQLTAKAAPAHILVQELMILANSMVAKTMADAGVPYPFRNHRAASISDGGAEVEHTMAEFIRKGTLNPADISKLAHLYKRATYESASEGHIGLRLPHYTHFTSPIRRYPDLVGHRIVKAFIEGKQSPYTKEDLDAMLPGINERIQEERFNKSATIKQHSLKRAERQGKHAPAHVILNLDRGAFSIMLRTAATSGEISEEVVGAIRQRINEGRCPLVDMTQIMTVAPGEDVLWHRLRQEVLAHLRRNPHDAVTLLQQSKDFHQDKWDHEIRSQPLDGTSFVAYVVARINGQPCGNISAIRGKARKTTEQEAAVAFWEQYAAGTLVPPNETRIPEPLPYIARRIEQKALKVPIIKPDAVWKAWSKIAGRHGYNQRWDPDEPIHDEAQKLVGWRTRLTLTGEGIETPIEIPGEAQGKQGAKLDAIQLAMEDSRLPHIKLRDASEAVQPDSGNTGGGNTTHDPLYKLKEKVKTDGWKVEWNFKNEGLDHAPQWVATVTVNDQPPLTAISNNKKQAEREAAMLALQMPQVTSTETHEIMGLEIPPDFARKEVRRARRRQERGHARGGSDGDDD